jgi:hypothetical protein
MIDQLLDSTSNLLNHEKSKEVQLLAIDCVIASMLVNEDNACGNPE